MTITAPQAAGKGNGGMNGFLEFKECAGCGELFSVRSPAAAARAKWCSERCRKRQYAGTCEVCGGPTDGTTPSRGVATICQACRSWDCASIIDAIQRWAEEHGGIPPREIDFYGTPGWPYPKSVHRRFGRWNHALRTAGFGVHQDKSPERQAWIEKQLRAGVPTREIADALGVTPSAIHVRMCYRGTTVEAIRRVAA